MPVPYTGGNYKMFVALLIIFQPTQSEAFLDFLGEQAKKAIEVAAYVDAVAELSGEIGPSDEITEQAKNVKNRAESVRSEASNLRYLSRTTKSVLSGPDWTSRRLETNIRATTDYARKLKRLIARIIALGTDGATAFNTTETNVALTEVQKNQQALLLQNEDAKLREIEKEQEEVRQWEDFSRSQRKLRVAKRQNGKP